MIQRNVKAISSIEERDFHLPVTSFMSPSESRHNLRQKISVVVLFIFGLCALSWARLFVKLSEPIPRASITQANRALKNCKVAVGVFSKAADHTRRDVIRQTWGHPLTSTSTKANLFFVVGDLNQELSPHEKLQFDRERSVSHDLLLLNSSDSDEYAKSLEWFSWAAQMTNCETIFKTRDDTYLRVNRLLDFLNSVFGLERPILKYFGTLGHTNTTQAAFMSEAGYGVSRDVALWIFLNKNISVESPSEDVGIGNLISHMHRSSKLEYYTDSIAFGTICNSHSVLDSPLHSYDFNMYIRHQEDAQGKFCAGADRSVSVVHFKRNPASYFSFDSAIASKLSLQDESQAPWNRSNRWYYTEDRAVGYARAAFTFLPWHAAVATGKFGGAGVFEKSKAGDKAVYDLVVEKAKGIVQRVIQKCPKQRLVGTWLKSWGRRKEYIVHLQCTTNSQTALVHVPFKADGDVEAFSPAYVVGSNRLVMIVPISCRLDTLQAFLRTSGQQFSTLSGRKTKIILAWSYCHDKKGNFTESAITAVVQQFQRSAKSVAVQTLFFQDGSSMFSRSRALNTALLACDDDDIALVLDVDVQVKADFFLNCLAFARQGHSMYFPVMFSRFNPKIINTFGEVMSYSPKGKTWLKKFDSISADTGLWRDFSLGMVSMSVLDAKKIGMFNSEIQGWGNEDVEFFERAEAAGYMTWRLYEPNEIHIYHPKDCTDLKGTDRYTMCLGSKLRMEGNQLQVAIMLHKKEEEWDQKQN
uniref:Hexosyltransferase n=1 Tax=Cryptomonas curvata TaxID=233186 RepID=A0A7S0MVS8_9CRYP|mmetsp:Transcript_55588/g.116300  ORF Transcript_55588/g.116300 Transcript_55588/m.116300 type:complete len:753 (+) Transcript_55588:3-2261(+)